MNQSPYEAQQIGGTKLVIIALAIALVAVIATNIYIESIRRQVSQDSFSVFLLERSVDPGQKLDWADVREVKVPRKDFLDTFQEMGYVNRDDLGNRIGSWPVQVPARKGQVVTHALFNAGPADTVDRRITPGYRWKTIAVNSRTVPPILQPEMHVDIEAPFAAAGGRRVNEVLPVMENVRVVAVGAYTAPDDPANNRPIRSGFQNIMIELLPEQATQLSMIEQTAAGPFELELRKSSDDKPLKIPEGGINPRVLKLLESRMPPRPPGN